MLCGLGRCDRKDRGLGKLTWVMLRICLWESVISLSAVCIKLSRYEDWPFPVDGIGCFYKGKQR